MMKFLILFITILHITGITAKLSVKIASKKQVSTFLNDAQAGSKSKLVFYNDGSIYFLDFSEEPVQIHEIIAAKGGILPVISPDGDYFVFSRGANDDGVSNPAGAVYLCQLQSDATPVLVDTPAFVPRFVYNADQPTVVYSTCGKQADPKKTVVDGCGAVVSRSFQSGTFGPRDTLWRGGSYYGGLSWDGTYLATAWLATGNALMIDRTKPGNKPDTIHLHVANATSSSDSLIPIGVCNPSISSSRIFTDAMMYFDMGSGLIPPGYANKSIKNPMWAQHQLLFITQANGTVLKTIDQFYTPELTPDQFDALTKDQAKGQSYGSVWDNPEWSNHPYLTVASCNVQRIWTKKSGTTVSWHTKSNNEKITAINLKKSSTIDLLTSTDTTLTSKVNIVWPWFWAQIPENFIEESDWLATSISKPYHRRTHRDCSISGNRIISGRLIRSVFLYDLKGTLVWKSKTPDYSFNLPLEHVSNGTYLIHMNLADKTSVLEKYTVFSK